MDELLEQLHILYNDSITDEEIKQNADNYLKEWQLSDDFYPMSLSFLIHEIDYQPIFAINIFAGLKGNIIYRMQTINPQYKAPLIELTQRYIIEYCSQSSEEGIVNLAIVCLAAMQLVFVESPDFSQLIGNFDLSQHIQIVEKLFIEMSTLFLTKFYRKYALYDYATEKYEQSVQLIIEILGSSDIDILWLQSVAQGILAFDNFSVFRFSFDRINEFISQIDLTTFPMLGYIQIIDSCSKLSPSCDEENEFLSVAMEQSINISNAIIENMVPLKQEKEGEETSDQNDLLLKLQDYLLGLLIACLEMRCDLYPSQMHIYQFIESLISLENEGNIINIIDIDNEYLPNFIERISQFLGFCASSNDDFKNLSPILFKFLITLVDNNFSFSDIATLFNTVWTISPEACISVIQSEETTYGLIAAISEIDPNKFPDELKNEASQFILSLSLDEDDQNACLIILNYIEKIGISYHDTIPQFLELLLGIFNVDIDISSRVFYKLSYLYHTELLSSFAELIQTYFTVMQNIELTSYLIPGLLLYLYDDPNQELFQLIGEHVLTLANNYVEEGDEEQLYDFIRKLGSILHITYKDNRKHVSPEIHSFFITMYEHLYGILLPVIMGCENRNIQSTFALISGICFQNSIIPVLNEEGVEDKYNFHDWIVYLIQSNQFQLCHIQLFQYIEKVIPYDVTAEFFSTFDVKDPEGSKIVIEQMLYSVEHSTGEVYLNAFGNLVIRGISENRNRLQKSWFMPILKSLSIERPEDYNQTVISTLTELKNNMQLDPVLLKNADRLIHLFSSTDE